MLAEAGVSARRGIMATHLEPAYVGHPAGPLPVTERIGRDSLILPLFHTMTEAQQDRVVAALRRAAAAERRQHGRRGHRMSDGLVIVGAGGFARETAQAVRAARASGTGPELLGHLDDDPALHGGAVDGVPVLGGCELVHALLRDRPGLRVVVCVGSPRDYAVRARLVRRLGLPEECYAHRGAPDRLGLRQFLGGPRARCCWRTAC